jgi:hypothetical protein
MFVYLDEICLEDATAKLPSCRISVEIRRSSSSKISYMKLLVLHELCRDEQYANCNRSSRVQLQFCSLSE